jgi:hypothetical protein
MTTWTLAQAKRDYEIGYLDTFELIKAPMEDRWIIHLKAGLTTGPLVDARKKSPRTYTTLDAAISTLQQIGFKVEYLRR